MFSLSPKRMARLLPGQLDRGRRRGSSTTLMVQALEARTLMSYLGPNAGSAEIRSLCCSNTQTLYTTLPEKDSGQSLVRSLPSTKAMLSN